MAHFAQLDSDNSVIQVVVVDNDKLIDELGIEQEKKGIDFLKNIFGSNTIWIQTSYNSNFRKQYASFRYTYDPENDVFIEPQPFPSWTLNENFDWIPPLTQPNDGKSYTWSENDRKWILVNTE